MSNEEIINELKKDLVYNQYRDTYVIKGENLPFMAERLIKLFTIPVVINRDLELKRITEMLEELREIRNNHNDGYRTFYNNICDKLDVLKSKLIHGL